MGLDSVKVVEVANPMSLRFTCLRSWLLPSLIEFISNNSHAAFPQRVFEVGDCIIFDEDAPNGVKEVRKLGAVISHPKASFSEAKSVVEAILRSLGFKPRLEEAEHPSFIHGRLGSIFVNNLEVGLVGEIHPSVLTRWGILVPTVGFEMDLSQLFSIIQT
jgi:phenylalanyl-tRNA synthetase beta chain